MINPVSHSKSQPKRRSSSVSAVSRKSKTQPSPAPEPDIELFSNKRDNPLFFWSSGSGYGNSPPQQNPSSGSSSSTLVSSSGGNDTKSSKAALTAGERGRPVSRNSDHLANGARSSRPRSSSIHASTRSRGRSVSRNKYTPSSESEEMEQQKSLSKTSWNSSNYAHDQASSMKKHMSSTPHGSSIAAADTLHFSRRSFRSQSRPDLHRTSHPSPSADSSISNREDNISTGSLSEAEEKTIKAVYEQIKYVQGDNLGGETGTTGIYDTVRSEVRRAISDIHLDIENAIQRSKVAAIASATITDISPVSVKPGDVELVSEIRKDYAKKLGECQERAKKLREDLAVEEHRGQELTRILKETLPEPKTSTSRRSHKGRRTSSERKRMSKRLTDEAISYFDECVSISMFDSSDFSAAEDSAVNSVGTTQTSSLSQESPCISNSCGPESCPSHKQLIHSSSFNETTVDEGKIGGESSREWSSSKFHFSSSSSSRITENENPEVLQKEGGNNYFMMRNFEKQEDTNGEKAVLDSSSGRCKYYDLEGGHHVSESFLFDSFLLKNRIHSGGLHLCGGGGGGGGGIAISFLPFPSLI